MVRGTGAPIDTAEAWAQLVAWLPRMLSDLLASEVYGSMIAHREINEASTSSPSAASIYTLAALALPRVLERAAARRSRASAIGSMAHSAWAVTWRGILR
jgi:hypothetical protein